MTVTLPVEEARQGQRLNSKSRYLIPSPPLFLWLPRWLCGKESAGNSEDLASIPGLGRSPREGNGNLLQYSCLEFPMDRGAWWATVHGVAKSWTLLSV